MQFPRPPRPASIRGSAERGLHSLCQAVSSGRQSLRLDGKLRGLGDSRRNTSEGSKKSPPSKLKDDRPIAEGEAPEQPGSVENQDEALKKSVPCALPASALRPVEEAQREAQSAAAAADFLVPARLAPVVEEGQSSANRGVRNRRDDMLDMGDSTAHESNGLHVALETESPARAVASGAPARPLSCDFDSGSPDYEQQALPRWCETERNTGADMWESEEGREVWLHVYDLGPVTGRLNEFVLRGANLGAFHCGIEVLGDEWSFQGFHDAWDDPTLTGVVRNEPRLHPAYIYRESISLGQSPLDKDRIDQVLDDIMEEWPANMYHLVSRNCVTFAEEFAKALQAPGEFPPWVRGAMDACKTPAIKAIADYGWSVFKEWSRRQAEQEALAYAEAEAAEHER